ncbi:PREDICTED: uncharacterized protein LOC106818164 [Priapulus caudatus]|uniref:Uncharacterized protein LOC106818164 n=1 Tax=Priapulus caudatus TaxID=37621 RepID=A0ABM1F1Q2_PRICU|nr:PREDICTED: uncharacterized protein LOC106818164 [Priapulus caudatus]
MTVTNDNKSSMMKKPEIKAQVIGTESRRRLLRLADAVLSLCIFTPTTVFFWRGGWQLMDLYLYPNNPVPSVLISLCIGYTGALVMHSGQFLLQKYIQPENTLTFVVLSRLYSVVFAFTSVNHWRGVWASLDYYTGYTLLSAGLSTFISIAVLLGMGATKSVIASPFCICTDNADTFFLASTFFNSRPKDAGKFFSDVVFTVLIISSLSFSVWRGIWEMEDFFFFPNDILYSALTSAILGVCMVIVIHTMEEPAALLSTYLDAHTMWRLLLEEVWSISQIFAGITLWRGLWLLANLFFMPGDDVYELNLWISYAIGMGGCIILFVGNTNVMRGIAREGKLGKGEGMMLPNHYATQLYEFYQNAGRRSDIVYKVGDTEEL